MASVLKQHKVRDWMTANPITISPRTTLPEAHQIMKEKRIRRLPVVDENGRLVGIVTLGDVREASPSDATSLSIFELNYILARLTVDKIMTRKVITVTPDTPIYETARLMLEHKIGGLPVVEDGRVVGIITESDIFKMVVRLAAEE
jgi:acetoin utilization protein AcuB